MRKLFVLSVLVLAGCNKTEAQKPGQMTQEELQKLVEEARAAKARHDAPAVRPTTPDSPLLVPPTIPLTNTSDSEEAQALFEFVGEMIRGTVGERTQKWDQMLHEELPRRLKDIKAHHRTEAEQFSVVSWAYLKAVSAGAASDPARVGEQTNAMRAEIVKTIQDAFWPTRIANLPVSVEGREPHRAYDIVKDDPEPTITKKIVLKNALR